MPESLLAGIEREARSRRVSKSDIVRERLQPNRALPKTAGSEAIRQILEKSWAADAPSGPRRFLSPAKQKLAEIIRAKKLHR